MAMKHYPAGLFFVAVAVCCLWIGSAHADTDRALMTAHDFSFMSLTGDDLPLSRYQGKALLIVNTASKCGFTSQYEGLQRLYDRYRDDGLVVLGVPSGGFGGQEYETSEEIAQFCERNFAITFPMTEKTSVTGKDAHPFYQWAGAQKKGGLVFSKPRWNFHKYLVSPEGDLLHAFGSQLAPDSDDLVTAILLALPPREGDMHIIYE